MDLFKTPEFLLAFFLFALVALVGFMVYDQYKQKAKKN